MVISSFDQISHLPCDEVASACAIGRNRRVEVGHVAAFGSTAARLMRAYATQVEILRRLRNGGQQFMRVEHVNVNDGGQAVIGNVKEDAKV